MTHTPLLDIRDISVSYAGARSPFSRKAPSVNAVRSASLQLERGETLGIVGESGSGKSTLVRAILGLTSYSGVIEFDGIDLSAIGKRERRALAPRIQMVFQDPYGSLSPRMTIGECIAEPMRLHRRLTQQERESRVAELLTSVGLQPAVGKAMPRDLSGGQRQRVAIARAIALDPQVIVFDEATSSLDVSTQAQVLAVIEDLGQRSDLGSLFVTHDLHLARRFCDTVVVMRAGEIVERGPSETVLSEPSHPYTQELLASAPVPDPVVQRRRSGELRAALHAKAVSRTQATSES